VVPRVKKTKGSEQVCRTPKFQSGGDAAKAGKARRKRERTGLENLVTSLAVVKELFV
jgi:hypothetical protein